jgi:predicted transcriptional regulator
MNTLTLKLPPALDAALDAASEKAQLSKSELVSLAVIAYLARGGPHDRAAAAPSALALAGHLVGGLSGGPDDLASNPRHLDGFGLS